MALGGVLAVVLGLYLAIKPGIGLVTASVLAGVVLVYRGGLQLLHALEADVPGRLRAIRLLGGVVGILAGVLAFIRPDAALEFLTTLLGVYFVADGVLDAFEVRRQDPENRAFLLTGVAAELVVGLVLLVIPGVTLGTFVVVTGVALAIHGVALAVGGMRLRRRLRHG